ncbi:hypothetical protein ACOMHN_048915 [Nucella lapillus]
MAGMQRVVMSAIVLHVLVWSNYVTPVSAWFFPPSHDSIARANGKPVDDGCVAMAQSGDCQFYRCFEDRLACGAKGYMLRFGLPYCTRFHTALRAFTAAGQVFVSDTGRCLTKALLPYYQQDQVDCHRLSHSAFDAISSCYAANGFCQIVQSNTAALVDVYQPRHLFQTGALKIWREILEVTYHCEPSAVHKLVTFAFRLLSNVMGFFSFDNDA